jgi:hypothetical protein
MKRWAWNIFCALSLLILATSVTLWVRSYIAGELVQTWSLQTNQNPPPAPGRTTMYQIIWVRGWLGLTRSEGPAQAIASRPSGWLHQHWKSDPYLPWPAWSADSLGIPFNAYHWRHDRNPAGAPWTSQQSLIVPLWLFRIFAIPPLLWWRKRKALGGRGFDLQPPTQATTSLSQSHS